MRIVYKTSFEEGSEFFDDQTALQVPSGWGAAWQPGDKPGPVRPEIRPEILGADQGIRTGQTGYKIAHAYSFFDACLYKRFDASPGNLYIASAYTTAESDGGLACQIGIDPHGSLDFADNSAIIWSEWWGTDNDEFTPYQWRQIIAQAAAQAAKVTVFLRCKCRDPVQVNAGFFDDFELLVEDGAQPLDPGDGLLSYIDQLDNITDAMRLYIQSNQRACIVLE